MNIDPKLVDRLVTLLKAVEVEEVYHICCSDVSVYGTPTNWFDEQKAVLKLVDRDLQSNTTRRTFTDRHGDLMVESETTDVHTEHCCVKCGCKYGEEERCSVVSGRKPQSYACGTNQICDLDLDIRVT